MMIYGRKIVCEKVFFLDLKVFLIWKKFLEQHYPINFVLKLFFFV